MAGLQVEDRVFQDAAKWLDAVAKGPSGGQFAYTPQADSSRTMTAVGLLCRQYFGMRHDDPTMIEGQKYLMNHLPNASSRSIYYWYYATQVMHNMPGYEWDRWNRDDARNC